MTNILRFEFHKLFRKKSFYVCTGVMLSLLAVGLLMNKAFYDASVTSASEYGLSLFLSAVSSSSFTMICGIFTALLVCEDFDSNTVKNLYSRGYSRKKVFFAKGISVLCSTVLMLTVVLIFSGIIITSQFGRFAVCGKALTLIAGQYLFCIANAAFVLSAGFGLKKSGTTIAMAILGLSFGGTLLSLADALLKFESFRFTDYWISNFSSSFTSLATEPGELTLRIAASFIYTLIFIIIGIIFSEKIEQ